MEDFLRLNGHYLQDDLDNCGSAEDYWLHNMVLLFIELYYQMKQALHRRFSHLRSGIFGVLRAFRPYNSEIIEVRVKGFAPIHLKVDIKCKAGGASHNITEHFLKNFGQLKMAVGYFVDTTSNYTSSRRPPSPKMNLDIRWLYNERNEEYDMHPSRLMDNIKMDIFGHRCKVDPWKPKAGDTFVSFLWRAW